VDPEGAVGLAQTVALDEEDKRHGGEGKDVEVKIKVWR
jgi:hypothetical protein